MRSLVVDKEIKNSFVASALPDAGFTQTVPLSVTYNRIFILTQASGSIKVDDVQWTLEGMEIFLVSKGQAFCFEAGTRLAGFEIIFGDCFWEKTPASAANCKAVLFSNAALNQRLPLNASDIDALIPVCELLLQEWSGEDYPNKLDAMAAYLKIIMIKLANIHTRSNAEIKNFDNQLYQKFLELVSSRFHQTREVADFARALSVPARKLSDVCRSKSGLGAKEIINSYIIAEAKRSLQFSARPIKEIAYDLSFTTPEQFSHFFKKSTRVSPAGYRNIFVNIGR